MKDIFDWEETPDLNITPLVDIMLVLLATLMITTPVIVYEEEISLPRGSRNSKIVEDAKIEIRIDTQRRVYLKDQHYTLAGFPDGFLNFSREYDKATQIYIRADKNLPYNDVIFVLKSVKESGFQRVSLVTDG